MAEMNNTTAAGMVDIQGKLMDAIAQTTVASTVDILKGLVLAIIIFVLGWIVAIIISRIFAGFLKAIRLESYLKEHKLEDALGSVKISNVLVRILKYFLMLVALQFTVFMVELGTVGVFLSEVIVFATQLIGAFVMLLLAVLLGEYAKESIKELSRSPAVNLTARAVKLLVVYVAATVVLSPWYDTTLLANFLLTLLQAAAFGVALAFGIAFGLGSQDEAKDMVKKGRKHLRI